MSPPAKRLTAEACPNLRASQGAAEDKQNAGANCWRLPREIAALLWRPRMVNGCGFARRADFKRLFEASC